jgi:hypothetical protein
MRVSMARRRMCLPVMMGIVFLIASMIVPVVAGADAMIYTYTGTPFNHGSGSLPGNNITVQFTADFPLTIPPSFFPPSFIISCGSLIFGSADPGAVAIGFVDVLGPNFLPSHWDFDITEGGSQMSTVPLVDGISLAGGGNGFTFLTGSWSVAPVPVPPTIWLLGSGLIPLAWFRRRNRWGK